MDRRAALKNFVIISTGIALFPSCGDGKVKGSLSLKNIQLTGEEENLLAHLAKTIVPVKTGAHEATSHQFILTMIDDCAGKEDQEKFVKGLQSFSAITEQRFGKSFAKCNAEQRSALVTDLENNKDMPADVIAFYKASRSLALQHYTTSEYYLMTVRKYEMVPGRFHGCFPIKSA